MPERPDLTKSEVIHDMCTYHAPEGGQPAQYETINKATEAFIKTLVACAPDSPDRSVAIRAAREARMWANSAIANGGKY